MSLSNVLSCSLANISLSPIVTALETSLQQSFVNFKDLIAGCEQLGIESESYKTELFTQKQKCDSKNCSGSEALKKDLAAKERVIQQTASAITKLEETRNFTILTEVYKILCGETTSLSPNKDIPVVENIKCEIKTEVITPVKCKKKSVSPKKELSTSIEDVLFQDESVSEIEGTPGRKSPIIPTKKLRNATVNTPEPREKKKRPEHWPSPQRKSIKLVFTAPTSNKYRNGRLRQSRILLEPVKPKCVVDLTCSPEPSDGARESDKLEVKKLIRKVSSENDDTILPSPTSGLDNFSVSKSIFKDKEKFKRPLSLKPKTEKLDVESTRLANDPSKDTTHMDQLDGDVTDMEESINILKHNRFKPKKQTTPVKTPKDEAFDDDASESLLRHLNQHDNNNPMNHHEMNHNSPTKEPLAENMNVTNLPSPLLDVDSSMSLLRNALNVNKMAVAENNPKRKTPEKVEPVYKEPTVRKKSEKKALPAWCCDECKQFFGELYKDDAEAIARAVTNCSKHRGRTNPVRPKTPPGFWNPRWDVPTDTEEFNRRNNAN